ncbi:RICIN domain-containing protein [Variovorax sp. NFACC27]|uniref:RICIN domain-containing protein n=1 Tax=unclassified Variovorax TaxID=663243 RepID=UPI00089B9664|nr:hypothetical protein SAMN03159371_00393 [Variovorax sp. NFACC28]SEF61351.1 hypothetical protein SAMN03159365_00425 [Variovorax sp. NFACC29]SFB72728.1 hypothetical protein SAMN03159379_00424 [Variovorax sp. NFACC26]SFG56530.1 hypothetical protein SAMN03159447_03881 [Variovorax sp. NFACC27]
MSITEENTAEAVAGVLDSQDLGPHVIQQLLPTRYVLDVDGGSTKEGTAVISWTRKSDKGSTNQQWMFVPAGGNNPGWWYLQTNMGTGLVMTVVPKGIVPVPPPTPIVMMKRGAVADSSLQLWCLLPTEKLGYWYIQNKSGASNSATPMILTLDGDKTAARAVLGAISFTGFETQAWGFAPA